jgi:hypothetical protein
MRRALVVMGLLLAVTPLHADEPRATAVELVNRGRALAQDDKCAEAVPFFIDTLKLEPSIGALLNLAECYEKLGAASPAFTRYREAEALARDKRDDRELLARSRWQALVPRVPKIAVVAAAGVEVRIDGEVVRDVVPLAVGEHEVSAIAEGSRRWDTRIHVEGVGTVTLRVPGLERTAEPSPRPSTSHGEGKVAGVIIASAGAVALATGGVFGGVALARKNDAQNLSTGSSPSAFDDARASAKTFADASTVLFVVGGIVAAGGLTLWILSPRAHVAVSASLGWVGLRGSF